MKLVSLNIEGSLHVEKVLAFLREHTPDVVCLQELLESDISRFETLLGPCTYAPMSRLPAGTRRGLRDTAVVIGVGIFSKLPQQHTETLFYYRAPRDIPDAVESAPEKRTIQESSHRLVICTDLEKEGVSYRVATTHFTWTPDGEANEFQRTDVRNLLTILSAKQPLVICGDFNAARGKEIFTKIAEEFTDNIPLQYKGSIDVAIHRSGAVRGEQLAELMVDGLFSSSDYGATNVSLEFGVSDHAAIVATITKNTA